MRIVLLTAAASLTLLTGCRDRDAPPAGNSAATANASAAATPAAPSAAPVTGEQAKAVMHERHEGMEAIGKATKAAGRELQASTPDLAVVRKSAATIARLAPKTSVWFPVGTGPDVGKTGAKSVIWQKPEDFAAKARDFQQAAKAFDAAAQSDDVNAVKAAFGDLGKSCKACHDTYRSDMHKK